MDPANGISRPYRLNVLTLDGGGVRGISALLILRQLMLCINDSIRKERKDHKVVHVHEIFEFAAGTSTGGLIAIMLGKLGMTVDECIQTYHELSTKIFGKKHIRGRITHGLAPTRYSGSRLRECVRDLVTRRGFDENLPMVSPDGKDNMACAVVCREHHNDSKYSDIKSGAIRICSLPCGDSVECHVCDAARATSAAPTFFPVQNIAGRSFVDGGMEHNNPSQTIFHHYTEYLRVAGSKRNSVIARSSTASNLRHGNLDFSRVRFVNLGTGTKADSLPSRRRDKLAALVPGAIRMGIFLKRTLTEFAVNSENTADHMRTIAWVSGDNAEVMFKFERFSADNGVCYVKLDSYQDLQKIQDLTLEYLDTTETKSDLGRVAAEIAREYLQRHSSQTAPSTDPVSLPVHGESSVAVPSISSSQDSNLGPNETKPSSASSSANFNDSMRTQTSREASTVTEPDTSPVTPITKSAGDVYIPANVVADPLSIPTESTSVSVSA